MSNLLKNLRSILESFIMDSSKVFIVGHNEPDFDSIGSAIGLQVLATFLGKDAYIIVNDEDIDLEPGIRKIKDENRELYNIINIEEFKMLNDNQSLLVMTDVNKADSVSIKPYLADMGKIVVIDHHSEDDKTVVGDYKYNDLSVSSCSEIVAQILNSYKFKYSRDVANFLLAGIILDTKRYIKNTSSTTFDVAKKLMLRGADLDYANDLFLEEFDDDRKINDLIFNGTFFHTFEYSLFQTRNISFTLNREHPNTIYRKEDIAKAADRMLKYRVDAAFVLGYVKDGLISISARSKNNVDVGVIMSHMNGGGNKVNAGGRIESQNILEIEKELMQQMEWGIQIQEESDQDSAVYIKLKD